MILNENGQELPWPKFKRGSKAEVKEYFSCVYKRLVKEINYSPRGMRGNPKDFFKKKAMREVLKYYLETYICGELFPFNNRNEVIELYNELKALESPIPTIRHDKIDYANDIFKTKIKIAQSQGKSYISASHEAIIKLIDILWETPLDSFEWLYSEEEKQYWLSKKYEYDVIDHLLSCLKDHPDLIQSDSKVSCDVNIKNPDSFPKKGISRYSVDDKLRSMNTVAVQQRHKIDVFINAFCIKSETESITTSDIYDYYFDWIKLSYPDKMSQLLVPSHILGRRLSSRGFNRKRTSKQNGWFLQFNIQKYNKVIDALCHDNIDNKLTSDCLPMDQT